MAEIEEGSKTLGRIGMSADCIFFRTNPIFVGGPISKLIALISFYLF